LSDSSPDSKKPTISAAKANPSAAEQALQFQENATKISHDEWVRRKDHANELRAKLIL